MVELLLMPLLLSAPDHAAARLPSLDLQWVAPDECPDEDHLRREVERMLGPYAEEPHAPLRAEVLVEAAEDGFALRMVVRSAGTDGDRALQAKSCAALADAAALVLAIAIDPRVLERVDAEEPEPEPEPEPESEPEPEPEPEPESEPAPVRPLHVAMAGSAGAGFVVLPGIAADLGLLFAISGRRWRLELGGTYWTPSEQRAAHNDAVGGRFQLWGVDARGCWVPSVARVDLPLCLGAQIGAMHGRGVGELAPARTASSIWAAALGSVAAIVRPGGPAGRLGLGLRVEGLAALTRPQFGTEASGVIYRAGPGGARIGAMVEVRLR